jgi:ABC-type amino acid transport substrate-binding protein
MTTTRLLAAFFIGVFFISTSFAHAQQSLLTPEQNAWLDTHKRTIVVQPQESDPPYVFAGSGTVKQVKGFSVEYIDAVAKKLNIKVVFGDPAPLDQLLASARERNDGVILSLTPTTEREQYLYFTDSYYDTPAVIAVRKDFSSSKKILSLDDFSGKKVAIGNAYAVQEYVQANYPEVKIVSVQDDQAGLQKLLLGDVDAVVMDFGTLSYYTSNDVLSYIKIIGRTGFEYKHSIAIPKSSPELVLILNKGLKDISDAEKQVITNKWLEISVAESQASSDTHAESSTSSLIIWLIFAGFIIFIAATIVIVILLRKRVSSTAARKKIPLAVQTELDELRIARETLQEDMAQIATLEKTIEEKISEGE